MVGTRQLVALLLILLPMSFLGIVERTNHESAEELWTVCPEGPLNVHSFTSKRLLMPLLKVA